MVWVGCRSPGEHLSLSPRSYYNTQIIGCGVGSVDTTGSSWTPHGVRALEYCCGFVIKTPWLI